MNKFYQPVNLCKTGQYGNGAKSQSSESKSLALFNPETFPKLGTYNCNESSGWAVEHNGSNSSDIHFIVSGNATLSKHKNNKNFKNDNSQRNNTDNLKHWQVCKDDHFEPKYNVDWLY